MDGRRRLVWLACGSAWPCAVLGQASPALPPGLAAALARARALRDAAVLSGDQPYGAVVVDAHWRIVGEAPSRVVTRQNLDAHAEREALRDAARRLGGIPGGSSGGSSGRDDLSGLLLVSSSRPCPLCEAAAARAGIARMFHGEGTDAGPPQAR